jgi:hypothetical protein
LRRFTGERFLSYIRREVGAPVLYYTAAVPAVSNIVSGERRKSFGLIPRVKFVPKTEKVIARERNIHNMELCN